MSTSRCTSEASQSPPAGPSRAPSNPASPPPLDDVAPGVPWADAVKDVVNRAVGVAVAVPRIAATVFTVDYPIPSATTSTGPTVVVPVLVQATARLEPVVFLVVVDAVIDAFIMCLGMDARMVTDLKGVPPPTWSSPFECAALPPRLVRCICSRATTTVALLLAGASRDLMCTVGSTSGGAPLSSWRPSLPTLEAAVNDMPLVEESTHNIILKATCAAGNAAKTIATSPIDVSKAAAAISATLTGYNTAKAAAASAQHTASLVEQAAAELRSGVVVSGVGHLVNVDSSMNEALEIANNRAAHFIGFATKCMQAAELLARALEAGVSP